MSEYVVEMLNITKTFPGIVANDNITLQLKKGEIHALLGENGAGKSTLMSILFGMIQPTSGEIRINGEKVVIDDPNVANEYGIGMVHQHFKLVDCFTVLENIILGSEPRKGVFLDIDAARKKVEELSEKYCLNVDLDAKVEDITVGMQQRTEILKMLYRDNDVLILDEPTAVLTPQEIEELLEIMKKLSQEGKSILFITHKLVEIITVSDRCSIIRKGKYIGTVDIKNTTEEELATMMVGRKVNFDIQKKESNPGDVVLKVRNMCIDSPTSDKKLINNISLDIRRGEIVGIAGIDGNGQSDFIFGLTGLKKLSSGSVFLNETDITNFDIRKKSDSGLSCIHEDRHKHGLVLDFPLKYNIVLGKYYEDKFTSAFGFLKEKEIEKYSQKIIDDYDVRSANGNKTITRNMSGGNQQKAIIGREIDKDPDLLIAVQPTRGLDVGAIEGIHKKILECRDNNKAVLLVSFELSEIMQLSDRIMVMYEGEFVGEFKPDDITNEELGLYMAGAKRDEVKV